MAAGEILFDAFWRNPSACVHPGLLQVGIAGFGLGPDLLEFGVGRRRDPVIHLAPHDVAVGVLDGPEVDPAVGAADGLAHPGDGFGEARKAPGGAAPVVAHLIEVNEVGFFERHACVRGSLGLKERLLSSQLVSRKCRPTATLNVVVAILIKSCVIDSAFRKIVRSAMENITMALHLLSQPGSGIFCNQVG